MPERRAVGFTVEPMVVVDRKFPPIVGLARTGLIRAKEPPRGPIPPREDWYDYVAADGLPTIAVIQDIDDRPGFGAFWGEVQTTVHAGLGVAGCVTNGSFRDIDMLAPGFQIVGGRIGPSHAHVHMVQMNCDVNIFGMLVAQRRCHPRRFPRRGGHSGRGGARAAQGDRPHGEAREGDPRPRPRAGFNSAACARRCAPRAKSTSDGEEDRVDAAPLRVGVIGCGFFAENHLAAWSSMDDVVLAAVCDIDLEKARSAAERHKRGSLLRRRGRDAGARAAGLR